MTGQTIETLESRLCLSSHHGGDSHVGAMHADVRLAAPAHAMQPARTFKSGGGFATQQWPSKPQQKLQKSVGGMEHVDAADRRTEVDGGIGGGVATSERTRRFVRRDAYFVGLIVLPPNLIVPVFEFPPVATNTGGGQAPAAPAKNPGTAAAANQAQMLAPADADVSATRTDTSAARELLAANDATGAENDPVLATIAAPAAAQKLAASTGSVIDRLTSTWHDGIIAAVGDAAAADAQSSFAHMIPTEAMVTRVVDAATNLVAPLAETAASLTAAITPAIAKVAVYDIAHMGSPFALLADSLATFVEESATVSNVVAQADSRGPWALTAGVIAADVVVLTYVYRRKSTRRRAQLAMVGVA